MSRDLHSNIKPVRVLSSVALTTTLGAAAKIVDRAGYEGVEFIINVGSRSTTGGSIGFVMKEGAVTGTLTSVADANMIGLEANIAIPAAASLVSGTHKNVVKRIGYIGLQRYVTLIPANAGSMTSCPVGITAILSGPHVAPVAT